MTAPRSPLTDMNERLREVFRRLVETWLDTGEPVGSRTLARPTPKVNLRRRSAT